MRVIIAQFLLSSISLVVSLITTAQGKKQDNYLIMVSKSKPKEAYGYRDKQGKVVIPLGKYPIAFTDTFRTHAIVLKSGDGFVAIDRHEKVLYHIYPFDNGPDYPAEGLYRIIEQGKIGYADLNGNVVIAPQFTCAYPFDKGKAKVSTNCTTHKQGEHSYWESSDWFYIDKKGTKL
jgi:hypothetical protein